MATKQSGKILRIGILQGGRIIEERFIRTRDTVTVGESHKATFILPFSNLPIPKLFPLFTVRKDLYDLHFTETMSGKITVDGKVTELKNLIQEGKAPKRGKANVFQLTDSMRGKIKVGDVIILFTFVKAPPIPAKPKLPASIRGGWVKSIDWVYVAILLGSFVLHSGILGYASTQPIPKKVALEAVPERFAKIVVPEMPKEKEEAPKTEGEGEGEKKKEKKKVAKKEKSDNEGDKKPKKQISEKEMAEAAARRKAEIAKKVAGVGLNRLLTAKGPGGSDSMAAIDTLLNGGDSSSIDEVMQGVTGMGIASKSTERGLRAGDGAGGKAKDIGSLGVSEGGKAKIEGRQETQIKAKTKMGNFDVDGELDGAAIKRVVRRGLPAITLCYEMELRLNPKLKGKVTVDIEVAGTGAVSMAEVISSSLNNKKVESCIVKKIRRWRFPKPEGGSTIITYPFIFEGVR